MAISGGSNVNSSGFIESPPIYDVLTKNNQDYISGIWMSWIDSFVQSIAGYLSQNGILPPQLTTTQRDAIINPVGGQMIYNVTIDAAQIFILSNHSPIQGNWKTVTVT